MQLCVCHVTETTGGVQVDLDEGLSSECEALLDVSKGAMQHGCEGVHSLPPAPHLLLCYLHPHQCEQQATKIYVMRGSWVGNLLSHRDI